MKKISTRVAWILALGLAPILVGCASKRPALYPNLRYQQVGPAAAERDVDECLALAKGYRESPGGKIAAGTAKSAATGAAVGAATGAIRGNAGIGAAIGAAAGGTASLMHALLRPRDRHPLETRYANYCLAERGYHVLGWR